MNLVKGIRLHKNRNSVSVLASVTVFEALKVIAENNIDSVPVLINGSFQGMPIESYYLSSVELKNINTIPDVGGKPCRPATNN